MAASTGAAESAMSLSAFSRVAGRSRRAFRSSWRHSRRCGRGQPRCQPVGFGDPIQVLHQSKPGHLNSVVRVGHIEPVATRDRPHQAVEPSYQPVPGCLVAVPSRFKQRRNLSGQRDLPCNGRTHAVRSHDARLRAAGEIGHGLPPNKRSSGTTSSADRPSASW